MKTGLAVLLVSALVQVTPAGFAAESPKLEHARKVKSELDKALRNEDQNILPKLNAFSEAQKPLLRIRLDGKEYQATAVYFGPEIKARFQCSTIYADDTIHATEGLAFIGIPWHPQAQLSLVSEWPMHSFERLEFWAGEPGPMHDSGYSIVRPVPLKDGRLIYSPPDHRWHDDLIFCILRIKGEDLYRKFVFVVVSP